METIDILIWYVKYSSNRIKIQAAEIKFSSMIRKMRTDKIKNMWP